MSTKKTITIIIIIIIYCLRDWWLRVNVLFIARNYNKKLNIIPTKRGSVYNTLILLLMRKHRHSSVGMEAIYIYVYYIFSQFYLLYFILYGIGTLDILHEIKTICAL